MFQHIGQAVEEEPGGIVPVIQQRRHRALDLTQSAGHLALDGVHVPPRVQIRHTPHLRFDDSCYTRHGATSNTSCMTRKRPLAWLPTTGLDLMIVRALSTSCTL